MTSHFRPTTGNLSHIFAPAGLCCPWLRSLTWFLCASAWVGLSAEPRMVRALCERGKGVSWCTLGLWSAFAWDAPRLVRHMGQGPVSQGWSWARAPRRGPSPRATSSLGECDLAFLLCAVCLWGWCSQGGATHPSQTGACSQGHLMPRWWAEMTASANLQPGA